jgi:hypothetical protein
VFLGDSCHMQLRLPPLWHMTRSGEANTSTF